MCIRDSANGILKVSAKDLDTGKQQSITITANDSMSEQEIQQAIRDAHEYAGQDQTRKACLLYTSIWTSVPPVTPALSPHSAERLHVHLIPAPVPEPLYQIPVPDHSP